jgi:hypothetical protein
MRLPWGTLEYIADVFLQTTPCQVVGCLSPEERSVAVPIVCADTGAARPLLIAVEDPHDAFPDYSQETQRRIDANAATLSGHGIAFRLENAALLATEDELDALVALVTEDAGKAGAVVLDITAFPKRFFCFIMKQLLSNSSIPNLVVTYTQAETYTTERLAEDTSGPEALPGFAGPPPPSDTLVVSVGFETFSIESLIELYRAETRHLHFLMPFPPDGDRTTRTWRTLMQLVGGKPERLVDCVDAVAAWDAERVYTLLKRLKGSKGALVLAPFGPKPHTLGMALFALSHKCGLSYSQPKSYRPDYSGGWGRTWAYVLKWQGVTCIDR